MLLAISFMAALALGPLLRVVMHRTVLAPTQIQAPRADSLYFEMRTGLIIAAGTRVSQLLGYHRAADCLAQFDRMAHFKNASLVQLISGEVNPAALVLQTAQGQVLPDDLRIRVIGSVDAVEVQAAVKVERRARSIKPVAANPSALPMPSLLAPQPLFAVLADSHTGDPIETYHALFDRKTLRLQASPALNHRMGFSINNRWLSLALWRRCLDPTDRERVLQGLPVLPAGAVITCRVASLTGELLFLRLTVIALPDPWRALFAGRSGDGGASLLKVQVDPPLQTANDVTTQLRHRALVDALATQGDKVESEQQGCAAQSPDGVASRDDELMLADQHRSQPAFGSEAIDSKFEPKVGASLGRVLLIEDDQVVRQALLPMLSEAGLSVTTASSLGRAIERWQQGSFDLVLTDRNLGRDSIEPLLDKMALEESTVPVLLMTAEPFDHPVVYSALAKPFDLAAFKAFLEGGLSAMQTLQKRRVGVAP